MTAEIIIHQIIEIAGQELVAEVAIEEGRRGEIIKTWGAIPKEGSESVVQSSFQEQPKP